MLYSAPHNFDGVCVPCMGVDRGPKAACSMLPRALLLRHGWILTLYPPWGLPSEPSMAVGMGGVTVPIRKLTAENRRRREPL